MAEKFFWDFAGEVPLILKLNGKTEIPPDDEALSPVPAAVEDAVRLGMPLSGTDPATCPRRACHGRREPRRPPPAGAAGRRARSGVVARRSCPGRIGADDGRGRARDRPRAGEETRKPSAGTWLPPSAEAAW